jgi:hypothetical protein
MLPFTFLEEQARDRTSSALAAAELRRLRRTILDRQRRSRDAATLRQLLSEASTAALDDVGAWTGLRERAAEQTDRLARAGRLPRHLVVTRSDPPVVAARTLAAAWRRLLRLPDDAGERVSPARAP